MRRTARMLGAALLVLASTQVFFSGEARAEPVEAYGWWSLASPDQAVPLPAAVVIPGAPTDGLYVAVGPNVPGVTGPQINPDSPTFPLFTPIAVGAVRFSVPEGATAQLTLPVTAGSNADQVGASLTTALLACQLDRPEWKPAQNGAWEKRPAYDCNAYAALGSLVDRGGQRQAVWDLPPAYQNPPGVVNVAIVAVSEGPLFIAFDAPTEDAVAIIDNPPPEEIPVDGGAVIDGAGSFVDGGFGSAGDVVGDFGATPPPADAGTAQAAPAPRPAAPTALIGPARSRPVAATEEGNKGRAWAVLGLFALGALLFFYGGGSRQVTGVAMRGVGRFRGPVTSKVSEADLPVRGIGRFAVGRAEPPRRLL